MSVFCPFFYRNKPDKHKHKKKKKHHHCKRKHKRSDKHEDGEDEDEVCLHFLFTSSKLSFQLLVYIFEKLCIHIFIFFQDDDDDFEDDTLKIKLDGSFNNTTTYSIRSPMYHNR